MEKKPPEYIGASQTQGRQPNTNMYIQRHVRMSHRKMNVRCWRLNRNTVCVVSAGRGTSCMSRLFSPNGTDLAFSVEDFWEEQGRWGTNCFFLKRKKKKKRHCVLKVASKTECAVCVTRLIHLCFSVDGLKLKRPPVYLSVNDATLLHVD